MITAIDTSVLLDIFGADPTFGSLSKQAARAAIAYGFDTLGLSQVVSFTTEENWRSRAVMERLGMQHDPRDDYDHPSLEKGHALQRHVLYRLAKSSWAG